MREISRRGQMREMPEPCRSILPTHDANETNNAMCVSVAVAVTPVTDSLAAPQQVSPKVSSAIVPHVFCCVSANQCHRKELQKPTTGPQPPSASRERCTRQEGSYAWVESVGQLQTRRSRAVPRFNRPRQAALVQDEASERAPKASRDGSIIALATDGTALGGSEVGMALVWSGATKAW